MNNKRTIILLVISILIVIVATVSVTYAYISMSATQKNENTISTTCFETTFTDSNRINITSYPMSSTSAFSKLTPYNFTITNSCDTQNSYQVILNIKNTTSEKILPYINYSLDGSTVNKLTDPTTLPTGVTSSDISATYIIAGGTISGINASSTYDLYIWIDESAGNEIMGSTFEAEIIIYNVAG